MTATAPPVFWQRLTDLSRDPASGPRLIPIILQDVAGSRALYDDLLRRSPDTLVSIVNALQIWLDRAPVSPQRAMALEMLVKAATKLDDPSLTCGRHDPSQIVAVPGLGGGHSSMSRAVLNGKDVIVKSPKRKFLYRMLQREALVSRQLRHPAILGFIGITWSVPNINFGLVLPMMEHGDLYNFLYNLYSSAALPNQAMYEHFLEDVASGICYLHSNGVVHADIKPQNILVRKHNGVYSAVIADFGIAIVGDDAGKDCRPPPDTSRVRDGGSHEQQPERSILGQPLTPDFFSDIWSWGIMAVWSCTLMHPSKQYLGEPLVRPLRPSATACKSCVMDDGLWHLIYLCTYRAREDNIRMPAILQGLIERRNARGG